MSISEVLQAKGNDVITVAESALLSEAADVLSKNRIGAVVILDAEGTVAGILSERDIVREVGKRGGAVLSESVDSMMTTTIVTCQKGDGADDVLQKMTDGRFRHMPVMEGDEMVGLITLGDVVKARLSQLAMEKQALEGMIMGH